MKEGKEIRMYDIAMGILQVLAFTMGALMMISFIVFMLDGLIHWGKRK